MSGTLPDAIFLSQRRSARRISAPACATIGVPHDRHSRLAEFSSARFRLQYPPRPAHGTEFRVFDTHELRELVEVALSNPQERGLPFSNWSVPKLADYCRAKHLLPAVTDEWIRRLLRREGLTAQRIRTWKTSNDPHFDRKKN